MTEATTLDPRPPRRRRFLAGRTLRFRVLASLMALVVGACLVLGVVTILALQSFLIRQLDHQLEAAGDQHVATDGDHDGDDHGPDPDHDGGIGDSRGQAIGTLGIRMVNGKVATIGIVGQSTPPTPSAKNVRTFMALPSGHPGSRDLGSQGDWRLLAMTSPDGDRIITGLPLRPVNDAVERLLRGRVPGVRRRGRRNRGRRLRARRLAPSAGTGDSHGATGQRLATDRDRRKPRRSGAHTGSPHRSRPTRSRVQPHARPCR